MIYETDWHIHTEASYDADLKVSDLIERAKQNGIRQFGISDHVNYPFMVKHLERSKDLFAAHPTEGFHFGVELTTLPKSQYDFALKHPADPDCRKTWLLGYIPPIFKKRRYRTVFIGSGIRTLSGGICNCRRALVF